jgi:polygalacturonase
MIHVSRTLLAVLLGLPIAAVLHAQDARNLAEPTFPAVCNVYRAPLTADATGPVIDPANEDTESARESTAISRMLQQCPARHAVELALGPDPAHSAFLINPLSVPAGVSLILDGGVTVYASRNPNNYQIAAASASCGTVTTEKSITGICKPILTFLGDSSNIANSGLYGYGVLDGQGQRPFLVNPTPINGGLNPPCPNPTCSWWDLIAFKSNSKKSFNENSPYSISAGNTKGGSLAGSFTLYKVTVRNPPFHTFAWGGTGLTAWGVHIMAPWNVPNTDGFDVHGTDLTLYDTTVANGDDDIAIFASDEPTTQVTVRRFATYARDGLTILGNGDNTKGDNISQLLFEDITQSADVPSFVPSPDGATATINGVTSDEMKQNWDIDDYHQALPAALGDVHGINIKYNTPNAEGQVANITGVTYRNVCMHDVEGALLIAPQTTLGSAIPVVSQIRFENIHVLAPSPQFVTYNRGKLAPPSYQIDFSGVTRNVDAPTTPSLSVQYTLSNVVFDDLGNGGGSSVSSITAQANELTTQINVYPAAFNALAAPLTGPPTRTSSGNTELTLNDNTYGGSARFSTPRLALPCSAEAPFLTGDLYAASSTEMTDGPATRIIAVSRAHVVAANAETDIFNVATAGAEALLKPASWTVVKAGASVTLNAVVQPVMSQTTYFMKTLNLPAPGRVAIGSPALTNQVSFYEGPQLIGRAALSANGTLATLQLRALTPGLHLYTAQYPKDDTYSSGLVFGLIAIYATR